MSACVMASSGTPDQVTSGERLMPSHVYRGRMILPLVIVGISTVISATPGGGMGGAGSGSLEQPARAVAMNSTASGSDLTRPTPTGR